MTASPTGTGRTAPGSTSKSTGAPMTAAFTTTSSTATLANGGSPATSLIRGRNAIETTATDKLE